MKILMLDFDGVLNALLPHGDPGPYSKAACGHLNTLLAKVPDLRIVISSAHRKHGLKYCQDILKDNGIDSTKAIDTTPLNEEVGKFDRERDIKLWLDAHQDVKDFVILDDTFSMPDYRKEFVKTNSYVGFTESDMKKALEILGHKE